MKLFYIFFCKFYDLYKVFHLIHHIIRQSQQVFFLSREDLYWVLLQTTPRQAIQHLKTSEKCKRGYRFESYMNNFIYQWNSWGFTHWSWQVYLEFWKFCLWEGNLIYLIYFIGFFVCLFGFGVFFGGGGEFLWVFLMWRGILLFLFCLGRACCLGFFEFFLNIGKRCDIVFA